MKHPHEKYNDNLIISRLQQIELASLKPSLAVDSPFFHLLTVAKQQPFFDNLPLRLGMEFRLIGSKILSVHLERGYFFQDLETNLSTLAPVDMFAAIARLNLASPIFYQAALFAALMKQNNNDITLTHHQFFTEAMEYARVAHHLAVIKSVLFCSRLSALAEIALDCEEMLRSASTLFNRVRTKNDPPVVPQNVDEQIDLLSDTYARAEELAFALSLEEKLIDALQKKAVVPIAQAGGMGLTGPYLRANLDPYDLRRQNQSLNYLKPPRPALADGGDAWARFSLRPLEILASLKWLKQNLADSDEKNRHALIIDDTLFGTTKKTPMAFGEVEGPEGIIKVSIFTKPDGTSQFRVRSPAYFIAQAIPQMLHHLELNDVAIIAFSLGISAEEVDK